MSTTRHTCPECDSLVRKQNRESVCTQCGLIIAEDNLDRGPEWRSFDDDASDPKRTGAPLTPTRHDRGLSTRIGRSRSTSPRRRRRMARLRQQHRRSQTRTKRERNQRNAFIDIRQHISALSLPKVVHETACKLFRQAQNAELLQGRSIEGFTAACVYAACRMVSISRTKTEVVGHTKATDNEFDAAFKALNRELDIALGPPAPAEFIPRYASQLGLSAATESRAHEFAIDCRERGISNGKNPSGVAAACLYTAALELSDEITQKDAASVADVSPVTVRNTYSSLQS